MAEAHIRYLFLREIGKRKIEINIKVGEGESIQEIKPMKGLNRYKTKWHQMQRRRQPAQATVEYALVLPVLLILILGGVDFGRMFYTKMVLTNAAREGANYLAYAPEDAGNGYADTFAAMYEEALSSNVELEFSDAAYSGCCTRGLPVEVTVTKSIDLIFDTFLQSVGLLGGPVELVSTVKMRVQ